MNEMKVPVEPSPYFVEYPINEYNGRYTCLVEHAYDSAGILVKIHELPSIVGFAGIKFRLSNGTETTFKKSLIIYSENGVPATPIKARLYIKGEK